MNELFSPSGLASQVQIKYFNDKTVAFNNQMSKSCKTQVTVEKNHNTSCLEDAYSF